MALRLDPERVNERRDANEGSATRGGQPLPQSFRHQMEAIFGANFSGVRIHQGHHATHVGAVAYTQGENIHFAPGHYDPTSAAGQELLGHELAHVVQQHSGNRIPDVPRGMVNVNLESEADSIGNLAGM
ncbi:DUF4157 domain-containing protein [Singulisphaera sp. GP187]|uniref:DUF4157 domain-containing protein n=1 Tax=Singulisphaera sp. GP187 TaxID=1882752 RepID=UPI001C201007|nr:DUF4157 domain-containing protein [Singulisphaera sp. GP187]